MSDERRRAKLRLLAATTERDEAEKALDALRHEFRAAQIASNEVEMRRLNAEYQATLLPAFNRCCAALRAAMQAMETAR